MVSIAKNWKKTLINAAKVQKQTGLPSVKHFADLMQAEADDKFEVDGKVCLSFKDGSVINLGTGETFTEKEWIKAHPEQAEADKILVEKAI